MMRQMSIFDGAQPFKIDKPIRLITLFSGYDSQALALKYLGVPFEHYRTCEWAIPSIQALHDLHFADDMTDYSAGMNKTELVEVLAKYGISADYNQPLTAEKIRRYSEDKLWTIYNNIKSEKNIVSIVNAKGKDLGIVDTEKYCYIMTYSFPCQDLSSAGLQKGMEKGSGTQSGLLWEVERLLKESKELPQVLLMENVPQVIGKDNIKAFGEWIAELDKLGYHSKWEVISATDYCVPQTRKRCFMISVLGDYFYTMPGKMKETRKLSDVLEDKVDQSYYLSEKQLEKYRKQIERARAKGMNLKFEPIDGGGQARTLRPIRRGNTETLCWNNKQENRKADTKCKNIACKGRSRACRTRRKDGSYRMECYGIMIGKSERFQLAPLKEKMRCLTTTRGGAVMKVDGKEVRIRLLTPKEYWRLMGVKDEDFDKISPNQSKSKLYHLAGDSIVTTCLMAIFGQMLDVDWEEKIKEVTK